ncbi:zinc finger CCHC-type and RNA-binding motif-containing protein 1-like [Manihot esculenta]|uniref:zinc finger CCHC-type and RNA-binding motif-containing protein 1-like n=1 Tax=Manihot esculenta TaxID=3983 RepID=UPI000B5D7131|nr:zinc finger CCHC-type and RNA-binding motif-containing protein 1-like [Manihot esculenta]
MALKLEKLTDGKKKSIALNIDTSESSNLSSYEEEMAMLVRKFRRAFRKGGSKCKRFVKKYGPKDDSQKDPKEIICYECNKPGHIRPNCPKNKKKKKEDKGKKAMVAVCDAIDESSSDDSNEKNEGNICCMALEKETAEPSKDEKIQITEETNKWHIDSECSHNMIGDKTLFSKLFMKSEGFVRFGDKGRAQIIENGTIGLKPCIENAALIQSLKYNLLSVSQLCDKGFKITFLSTYSENS